ncbi:hypothetical protein [Acidocella aminolytica]|uniref:hypothetical protein n=1 Tax=Acidocella aminolytica TaxID=33998 RepID=UPI001114BB3B|nr:hypothetical protein [Acidocella aminolytica]
MMKPSIKAARGRAINQLAGGHLLHLGAARGTGIIQPFNISGARQRQQDQGKRQNDEEEQHLKLSSTGTIQNMLQCTITKNALSLHSSAGKFLNKLYNQTKGTQHAATYCG